ncbi:MAG TPA: hypothetical protein VHC70_00650 [Phycisphaerales bacterium]|jgi:hypothetical protein|nr:hypothetical protein [Phycisphaerales bacterium]
MSDTRSIQFPADQADQLEAAAKAMGLTVPAYVEFLANCQRRQHDAKFVDAAKYVFKNYPQTLKKLAQ